MVFLDCQLNNNIFLSDLYNSSYFLIRYYMYTEISTVCVDIDISFTKIINKILKFIVGINNMYLAPDLWVIF